MNSEVGNIEEFKQKIEDLRNAIRNKMMNDISDIALEHFDEGFDQGGGKTDNSAGGWQRLSNGRQSFLEQTGTLRESIKSEIDEHSVTIYIDDNKAPYGKYHNTGVGRLPQREILGKSKELDNKIVNYILNLFKKTLK